MQRRIGFQPWGATLLCIVACSSKATTAPPPEAAKASHPAPPALPSAPPAVVSEPPRADLRGALCGSAPDCSVTTAFTFDPRADGSTAVIALVPLHSSTKSADDPVKCRAHDVWLARLAADGSVLYRQLVGGGCAEDTPYGDACDGLPVIRIEPPVSGSAPSAKIGWQAPGHGCGGWSRGGGDVEVSLETFSALRRSEYYSRAAAPGDWSSKRWDFARHVFSGEWGTDDNDTCPPRKRGPSAGVPRMVLPTAFVDHEWKSTSIEPCATTLSASHGVALPGTRRSTATLSALLSTNDVLFVEVRDPAPSPRPASLQVCFAETNAHMYDYCQMPFTPECVRLAMDGRRLSGTLAVAAADSAARFRIPLPPEMTALSVAYLDGRGGSIASSAYRNRDATSLGDMFPLGPAQATCVLRDGQLHFLPAPRTSTKALLDTEGLE